MNDESTIRVPEWIKLANMSEYQRLFTSMPEEKQLKLLRGCIRSRALELLLRGITCQEALQELIKTIRAAWAFQMLPESDVLHVVEYEEKWAGWRGVYGDNPYERELLLVVWKLVRDEFNPLLRS